MSVSELVTAAHPVVPIPNRAAGVLVHPNPFDLRKRYGKDTTFPKGQDEHLMLALHLGRHATDLYLISPREAER
jgi:hypothetical protein